MENTTLLQKKESSNASLLPEKIRALLASSNIDDIHIALIYVYKELGEEWMLENFTFTLYGKTKDPFPIHNKSQASQFFSTPNLTIIVGPICIEAETNEYLRRTGHKVPADREIKLY